MKPCRFDWVSTPVPRVDQDDGQVGGGRARHHVAGVLHVPGRVGDDELALRRGEVAVGHVDGDALLALGAEAVGQQREVRRVVAARAVLASLDGLELVLEDGLGIVEQPPDERAFAVVDAAGGREAEAGPCRGRRRHRSIRHPLVFIEVVQVQSCEVRSGIGSTEHRGGNGLPLTRYPDRPIRSIPASCGLPWRFRSACRRGGCRARSGGRRRPPG